MKYSNTYLKLNALAAFSTLVMVLAAFEESPTIAAICFASAFTCWFVAAKLPIHEKYRKGYKVGKGHIEL